jgi:hypothetical protein
MVRHVEHTPVKRKEHANGRMAFEHSSNMEKLDLACQTEEKEKKERCQADWGEVTTMPLNDQSHNRCITI